MLLLASSFNTANVCKRFTYLLIMLNMLTVQTLIIFIYSLVLAVVSSFNYTLIIGEIGLLMNLIYIFEYKN